MSEVKDNYNEVPVTDMPQFAYFYREFLGMPDDYASEAYITARVSNMDKDSKEAYANLSIKNDYNEESISLSFSAHSQEQVDWSMTRIERLQQVINDFAEAVKTQLNQASKNMDR